MGQRSRLKPVVKVGQWENKTAGKSGHPGVFSRADSGLGRMSSRLRLLMARGEGVSSLLWTPASRLLGSNLLSLWEPHKLVLIALTSGNSKWREIDRDRYRERRE